MPAGPFSLNFRRPAWSFDVSVAMHLDPVPGAVPDGLLLAAPGLAHPVQARLLRGGAQARRAAAQRRALGAVRPACSTWWPAPSPSTVIGAGAGRRAALRHLDRDRRHHDLVQVLRRLRAQPPRARLRRATRRGRGAGAALRPARRRRRIDASASRSRPRLLGRSACWRCSPRAAAVQLPAAGAVGPRRQRRSACRCSRPRCSC